MDINVTIQAPDLAAAIQSLADAIVAAGCIPVQVPDKIAKDTTPNAELAKQVELPDTPVKDEAKTETKTETAPKDEIKLETVRAKLAELSRDGKQAEAKKLLETFGVKKLTDLPSEKYPEILKAAEGL